MIPENLVSVKQFCGERFAALAAELERYLAIGEVQPEEIDGEKYYPVLQVDLALGALVRGNLTLAQAAERN